MGEERKAGGGEPTQNSPHVVETNDLENLESTLELWGNWEDVIEERRGWGNGESCERL